MSCKFTAFYDSACRKETQIRSLPQESLIALCLVLLKQIQPFIDDVDQSKHLSLSQESKPAQTTETSLQKRTPHSQIRSFMDATISID